MTSGYKERCICFIVISPQERHRVVFWTRCFTMTMTTGTFLLVLVFAPALVSAPAPVFAPAPTCANAPAAAPTPAESSKQNGFPA